MANFRSMDLQKEFENGGYIEQQRGMDAVNITPDGEEYLEFMRSAPTKISGNFQEEIKLLEYVKKNHKYPN